VDALGYPADFDPQTNTAVRVLAGRVRWLLDQYYRQEGVHDDIQIEIPIRTYEPIFRINSMPNDRAQTGLPMAFSPTSFTDYRLSITVIPFMGTSSNEDKFVADNITESIVTGLVHFRELRIVRTDEEYPDKSVKTSDEQRDPARIILNGRVQLHGNTLRISAGLTDTRTGTKIWAHSHEYPDTSINLLGIEDHIARLVVNALANYNGVIPSFISKESVKKRPVNMNIHEAIFCFEYFLNVYTMDAYFTALGALEHAVKSNPDNPLVLSMLCNAYCHNYIYDLGVESASLEKAECLAQRAVTLDPECQMTYFTEALLRFLQRQPDRCLARLRMTTELNPFNSYILHASGLLYCMLGCWEEGMPLWEQAMQINPRYPSLSPFVPFMYNYVRGNYGEAWDYAIQFSTPVLWNPLIRAAAAGQLGLPDQAKVALQELLQIRPDFPSRARDLMRRIVYLDEHVEMLLDGLLKAGLKLNPA
jgi:TolB-like protein